MTTQPPDLKKLREVAERATPGPWDEGDGKYGETGYVYCDNAMGSAVAVCYGKALPYTVFSREQEKANAAFIATFNPQTILALLDAYEASARDAERYAWLRDHDGNGDHEGVEIFIDGCSYNPGHLDNAIDGARHATQGD